MALAHTVINRRYIINNMLGQGGMGEVYRATDRLSGQVIALKQVTGLSDLLGDTPSTDNDFYLALSDEFRTLASIRHPNIINVLDYGFEDKQPYFTMELLEAPRTILEAGEEASLSRKIELVNGILQALVYLHRRGILHRDLKPGNILVTEAGIVKVLDFGLSLAGANSRSNIHKNTVGTIAYMAPELFADEPASVASDLYAVGVIACELLAGHHPFNQKNIALLINGILSSVPDLTGLDDEISTIVEKLLSKEPEDRYLEASDVIRDLCNAANLPLPVETSAVRESFLQTAKFTGRKDELQLLKTALYKITNLGLNTDTTVMSSQTWLVGGESGVGKSRLLEEVRIRALVRGALVLRGQAITEGSVPYHIWRDPIRRLILSIDLGDEDAAVLKNLVPDIDTLLERIVPEAPFLDPQISRERFMRVVTDMFHAVKQPIVMILEDLQWASDENLDLLKRLIPITTQLPVLIIASYRDDERPDLSGKLSEMQLLKLRRLDETSIADLGRSILGDTGSHPKIVKWLYDETEGNVFFLIEIVRELAEKAGELDLINYESLPENLLPEGIKSIVQRRLQYIPEKDRPLLEIAALSGRELDLQLLETFTPNLERWLEQCNLSAVLEVDQNRWRFVHDKLRESILVGISPNEVPLIHLKLAEKIEQVYAGDTAHIPSIAYHYERAKIYDKAAHYLVQAADLAKITYANTEAIIFCRGALNAIQHLFDGDSNPSKWNELQIRLYEMLGDLHAVMGKQEEARVWFETVFSQTSISNPLQRSRIYRKWANTWVTQRQAELALPIFSNAESILNDITDPHEKDWWAEWIDLHLDLMWANYWLNNPQLMRELAEKIRPVLDQFAIPLQRGRFFRSLALTGFRETSETAVSDETLVYAQLGLASSLESGDQLESCMAKGTLGLAYLLRQDWNNAEREFQLCLKQAKHIGTTEFKIVSLSYLTVIYRQLSQEQLVNEFVEMSMKAAIEANMKTYIAVAKANQSWVAWREGNLDKAQELGSEAIELWRAFPNPFPMQWMAYWILIGITHKSQNLSQTIDYIKAMLAPKQVFPRPVLVSLMKSMLEDWESGERNRVQAKLDELVKLASELNYL